MPRKNAPRDSLEVLWARHEAYEVKTFEIIRENGKLTVKTDHSYLFRHPSLADKTGVDIDSYWKGLVTEIKRIDGRDDALVNVKWFWSKADVEGLVRGHRVDPKLTSMLNAMASNELWPGQQTVINSSDSIECSVSAVHLKDGGEEPVYEYFFRHGWDEKLLVARGPNAFGCAKTSCKRTWNPDTEEQRFCHSCKAWYHTSCLAPDKCWDQDSWCSAAALKPENLALPKILLSMAYQPTARGGPLHFAAGNIRLVMKARGLVGSKEGRTSATGDKPFDEQEWVECLEKMFHLKARNRGRPDREQLVTYNQVMHHCPGQACVAPI